MPDDQQRDQAHDDKDEVHPGGRPGWLTDQEGDPGHRGGEHDAVVETIARRLGRYLPEIS
jgi:hypothetical protein